MAYYYLEVARAAADDGDETEIHLYRGYAAVRDALRDVQGRYVITELQSAATKQRT